MEDPEMCENNMIKDVMTSMGWHEASLPYASDENKKLMRELNFLGNTKIERIYVLESREKEAARAQDLYISVDGEFDQNLKLLTAHKSQYSTEYHLYKLAEHEESKYKQTLKETEKILKEQIVEQENLKSKFPLWLSKIAKFNSFCFCFIKMGRRKSRNRLTS